MGTIDFTISCFCKKEIKEISDYLKEEK